MNMVFGMNFFVFCFLALIVIFYFSKEARDQQWAGYNVRASLGENSKEAFGTSPGTMDQLTSTRAPNSAIIDPNRKPDQDLNDHIQANLTNKAIAEMSPSGSDDSEYASA